VSHDKQQIMSSRSFGRLLTERQELEEAVASYVATAARSSVGNAASQAPFRSTSEPTSSSRMSRSISRR
jgi:hypothetical protein